MLNRNRFQSAMREHVQGLQRENEELRDQCQLALQDVHTLGLEKEMMQKEVFILF